MSDLPLLAKATLRIYTTAAKDALDGLLKNWHLVILHCGLLLLLSIVAPLTMTFGRLAGGFLLGFLLAFAVGGYLSHVAAGVQQERLHFTELWSRAVDIFVPTISVLFVFFVFEMLIGMVLPDPRLKIAIGFLVCVLFNVLPELIYQRPAGGLQQFADSLEFIRENFIEWFLPAVLFVVPGIFLWGEAAGILLIFTANPLRLLQSVFLFGGGFLHWLQLLPYIAAGLTALYFVFLFRGSLFQQLASSTRRKRIYQEKFH